MDPKWLDFAQRIQAIAQTGLSYNPQPFDRERYAHLLEIAAEMMASYTDTPIETIKIIFDAQSGHATPKIDVRGVVFRDDRILMARENLDGGRWTVPGGLADINELPSQSVEREVYEETGYRVRATRLLGLFDQRKNNHGPEIFHFFKAFFLCELLSETPDSARNSYSGASYNETGESHFFAMDEIPAELSTKRVTHAQIQRFFVQLAHPQWPADFD